VPGVVSRAEYVSCKWIGGVLCSHTLARPELSGACPDDPKVGCIAYLTSDGNYKVISAKVWYMPDPPPDQKVK
jgi:hypothetical protein